MRFLRLIALGSVLSALVILTAGSAPAQTGATGGVDFSAHVSPSEGQPEPVRGLTFFLLSKSLADIRKEVSGSDDLTDLDHFIEQLDASAELKNWMKKHHRIDLVGRGFTKELNADDIVGVPEFLNAYMNQNGAALHAAIPAPKYKKGDEQKDPDKYKRAQEEYREALRHFIQANRDSIDGLDAELRDVNPYPRWALLQRDQQRHLEQKVMQVAQTRYLVATATSNLNGRGSFDNIPAGQYWISNLDTPAFAGDLRLHWDVAVSIPAAQTARLELSNLNAAENVEQKTQ